MTKEQIQTIDNEIQEKKQKLDQLRELVDFAQKDLLSLIKISDEYWCKNQMEEFLETCKDVS